ncbi:MAG TPA: M50 family metallopeptidase [Actinomycetota bacterium]|nr:M50 family metallopeptidase [Actinomycetota bacterium]
MPAFVGVLIFAFVVLLVIVAHESGHFFAAKAFGIKVEEFFVGFGPRLWSFRRGETEYGIKAIPAGGYVRIAGMNPFQETAPEDLPRTFGAKPPWQRAIVLLAGSFTHFVLALLLLAVYFGAIGVPERFAPRVAGVEETLEGQPSPAAEAGLQPGDEFVEVDGRPVRTYQQFVEYTRDRAGQELLLVVDRDGERVTLRATPVLAPVEGELVGRLGVTLTLGSVLERDRVNPLAAVGRASEEVRRMSAASFRAMGEIFSPSGLARIGRQLFGEEPRRLERDPAGIVGAARLSGQAVEEGLFDVLFFLFAGFNVFVGILNILPLPPLDGGHLAVVGIEKITGKRIDVRRLLPLTALVAGFLMLFMVSLLYLDVTRPLPNPFR